jgi:diguanylate cyclase (GGDEF)-like protein
MAMATERASDSLSHGNHFSCSMSAVLVARVHAYGGQKAVAELLELAGSRRSAEYLADIVNWISYDEAVALWRAGAMVTHHPQFARAVGEDAARRLNGSPIAALLRSLGSPERVFGQIATTATKYSVATRLETLDVGPGFAEIIARPSEGFPRSPDHCAWTAGLMTQPTILFGLPPAVVEHEECAALGAEVCRYRVMWEITDSGDDGESARNDALRSQLEAMKERLHSMFATASDLIGADDLSEVLARITDRAAVEIRAPSYLLAIRTTPDGPILCHHRGIDDDRATAYADAVLSNPAAALPESWLVVPVRSSRRDYGRLLALYGEDRTFFAEERGLLEIYARYAASALDSATALKEAEERNGQSSALLSLARALADAGASDEVAQRLASAVPAVIDCDRVAVALWDDELGELVERAVTYPGQEECREEPLRVKPTPGRPLQRLLDNPTPEPIFVDADHGDPVLRQICGAAGAVASLIVPLVIPGQLLGVLAVSVTERAARLQPNQDLLDRISGVAAQATTALQNGRLLDQITYQATHDDLTGLANRPNFKQRLAAAIHDARLGGDEVTAFYLDLDRFKPVNDEFGHDAGDALLAAAAQRLRACMRPFDVVARLGGDEFAILLESGSTADAVEAVAGRLRACFAEPFRVGGHHLAVGASIGRATYPGDAADAEQLLSRADAAMFAAKRERRGAPFGR